MNKAFNEWWNSDLTLTGEDNPFREDSPAFWAWAGWMAAEKTAKTCNPANILKLIDENESLRQICRNIYEVWAGSEGIPEPETACEAYLLQLVLQMKDEAKRGLK